MKEKQKKEKMAWKRMKGEYERRCEWEGKRSKEGE